MTISHISKRNFDTNLMKDMNSSREKNIDTKEKSKNTNSNLIQISISDSARKILALKVGANIDEGNIPSLKFDDEFYSKISKEVVTKRKSQSLDIIPCPKEISPLDNLFQVRGVKYIFEKDTLEYIVATGLEGKVDNPSLYASEIGKAIRSSIFMADSTLEERAIYRETALKNMEYIASNYFDVKEDAEIFLDKIKKSAENDILREKGYVVLDNSEIKKIPSYSNAINSDEVSFSSMAKKYFDNGFNENFINGRISAEELNEFYLKVGENKSKWEIEIKNEFEEKSKHVEKIIEDTEKKFEEISYDRNQFKNQVSSLLESIDKKEIANWHEKLLKLLY